MNPSFTPLISVVMAVWNTHVAHLRAAIDSVRAQSYVNWELCVADDGSTAPGVAALLDGYAGADTRIRVRHRATNGGTVAASNDAVAMATRDFVAFFDHDDILDPDALLAVAQVLSAHPDTDLVYTDEDKIAPDGTLFEPFHKPGWSPEYLLGCNYLNHLCVFRRSVVGSIGGLRPEMEGSQDWDLALRVSELTARIHHVPRVLYHWRVASGSTSLGAANKAYAVTAANRAVTDHLRRTGVQATCDELANHPGWFQVRYGVVGRPLVSIVIPAGGGRRVIRGQGTDLVVNCIRSILDGTEYTNYEIVCVLDERTAPQVRDSLQGLGQARIRFVEVSGDFNFSTKVNRGVAASHGSHVLLLNDDTEVISPGWLTQLLGISQQPGVGAVGGKLYFADGRVQHAGVVVMSGFPGHANYGADGDSPGYFGNLILNGNFRGVTGACLMTSREVFDEVGGFSTSLPVNYGDVDYCLKVGQRGHRVVFAPSAELFHYESSTRKAVVTEHELGAFGTLWLGLEPIDPFYSVHLAIRTSA